MKQAFTILILLAFLPFYSSAQQWAAPGTEWNFVQKLIYHDEIPTIVTIDDQFLENNILVSKLKIENHLGCGIVGGPDILTYSTSDGKVYFKGYGDVNFKILYNFQAEVGESWSIPFTYGQYQELVTYTVEEVTIVDVEGSPRRQLHCKVSFETGVLWSPEDAYIVEGVGDLYYLFPWQSILCDEGFMIGLCTYSDEEIGTYRPHPDLECVAGVSVNEIADLDFFEISPNPVSEVLNIRVPESAPALVPFTVFDLQGKVVHHGQLNTNGLFQLTVADWTPGLYFVKSNIGENIQVSKFMKQ